MKRAIEFLVLFSLCLLAGAVVGALARAEAETKLPVESTEVLPETPLIPPLPQLADRALERRVEGPMILPPPHLPPPNMPPHGFFPGPMADHVHRAAGPMADLCRNGAATVAGMAGFAQVKLAIAPEQMPAWQRFVEEATASLKPMQAQCPPEDRPPAPPADLPALLQQRQILLAAALESVTALKTALDKLMPVLTAEQRERMKDLVPPPPMLFHARGPMSSGPLPPPRP